MDVEAQRMLLPLRDQDQEDEAGLLIGDRHPGPAVGARIRQWQPETEALCGLTSGVRVLVLGQDADRVASGVRFG